MGNSYDPFFSWKPLIYADKCQAILSGQFLPPVMFHVYPTNQCPLDCTFCCMRDERHNPVSLSHQTFLKIIQAASDAKVGAVHVSGGGEPCTYNHLNEITKFQGLKCLSTNGVLLTPAIANMFNRVRVSVNAASRAMYCRTSNRDEFDNVCWNIRDVVKNSKVEIGLGFVVTPTNWQEVFSFCKMASDLGVSFVHIRPAYYPGDDTALQKVMDPCGKMVEAARVFTNIKIVFSMEKFEGFWTKRCYDKCLSTPLHAVFTATGNLIVCQDRFIRFGDMNKQLFQEIWGSEEHKQAIAKIDMEKCPRCVMNRANEIMEHVFIKDEVLQWLL